MSKRAMIINPYWDTLGGGEKHLASIGDFFLKNGYSLELPFNSKEFINGLYDRFAIDLSSAVVNTSWNSLSAISRYHYLQDFDIVLYATDGSYFFSGAKKNFVYSMYPSQKLYRMSLSNCLKWVNWNFISISTFTARYIDKWVGKSSRILNPYIEDELLVPISHTRRPIILNVGRFFGQLHTKNHKALIEAFKQLKESSPAFKKHSLCLVGGLRDEDQSYFRELQELCSSDTSITMLPNLDRAALLKLFRKAQYYWHATGLGVSAEKNPELVEHFGITPLEAAASGCIVVAHNSGGPKEIFTSGKNAFLYDSQEDLIKVMSTLSEVEDQKNLRDAAHNLVKEAYSYNQFIKQAGTIFNV